MDGVSNEPVIASTPTPISVEPRSVPAGEAAEVARQESEAKVAREAPKAAEAKAEAAAKPSIRDSIAKAQAKVNAEPNAAKPLSVAAKDAPAAAEAPAAKEAAPVAAKAADAPAAAAVTRGEDGKFVSTKAADPASAVAAVEKSAEPAKSAAPAAPLPSHTAEPAPKRFSAEAKEEWAAAPEKVRAEVARMEKELTAGFEKHRASAESFEHVREFDEMAKKGGTTLKEALSKYVGMENQLRADVKNGTFKGLEIICQNVGMSLRDVAAKILNQPVDQARSAADQRVVALEAEIAELKKGFGSITAERQKAQTDTTTEAVTKFAADHPRFEELADDISFFLKSGKTKDLAEAYTLAERLNPAPASPAPAAAASSAPAAVTRPTLVPPASTAGEKSIAGTPTAGSDPVVKQPSNSIKEALRRARAAAG